MSYADRMNQIEQSDREAREARELADLLNLYPAMKRTGSDPYHISRGISGEPSERNRTYRASDDCWKRGLSLNGHTIGIAPGTEDTSDGTATVAVTRNGVTEVVSANSFRRRNIATRQRRHATESRRVVSESERMAGTIGYLGNIE